MLTRKEEYKMIIPKIKKILFSILISGTFILSSCQNTPNFKIEKLCLDDDTLATFNPYIGENNTLQNKSNGLAYSIKGSEATVRLGTCIDQNIVVPSEFIDSTGKVYSVIGVDPSGFSYSDLAGIGVNDKYYLPTITSISLPDTISLIGSQAFKETALETFSLPKKVVNLNPSTFLGCTKLTGFEFNEETINNIGSYNILTIGDHCFEGCFALNSISLPNVITSIGDSAFKSCVQLPQIILPNSLVNLGKFAYENCYNALVIYINSLSIQNWGEYAFKGCSGADQIYLSKGFPTTVNGGVLANGTWNYLNFNGNKKYIPIIINSNEMDYWNGFYFTYDDTTLPRTCVIYGYDKKYSLTHTDVIIPAELNNNRRVVGIANDAFKNMNNLTSIQVGEIIGGVPTSYVASIGTSAFQGCTGIKKISLENAINLKIIEDSAFNISTTLNADTGSLVIPSSVEKIGNNAFLKVTAYTSIVFQGAEDGTSHLTSIGQKAFMANDQWTYAPARNRLYDVVFPSSLTFVGNSCFAWQFGIRSLTFKNTGALTLDTWAFSRIFNCQSITFSDIAGATTKIRSQCFEHIGSSSNENYFNHNTMTSVYLNSSISLNDNSFDNCERLTVYREIVGTKTKLSSIDNPNSNRYKTCSPYVPQYWNVAKNPITYNSGTGILPSMHPETNKSYLIHYTSNDGNFDFILKDNGQLVLSRYVFNPDDANFTSTPRVPASLLIDGNYVNVTTIGDTSFYHSYSGIQNKNLVNVVLPNTILNINDYAFTKSTELINVTNNVTNNGILPLNLSTIGIYVFGWTKISTCVFPTSLTTFGSNNISPFGENNQLTTIVLTGTTSGFSAYNNIIYRRDNATNNDYHFLSYVPGGLGGTLTIRDGCVELCQPVVKDYSNFTNVVLDRSIVSIPDEAFSVQTNLTSVSYSNTWGYYDQTTTIGTNAFYSCRNLKTFEYPTSLITIKNYAFLYDNKLESGDFSRCTNLTTIGGGAFYGCNSLTSIILPDSLKVIDFNAFQNAGTNIATFTELRLGNNVTSINSGAFQGCSGARSVAIPATTTFIGANAFKGCNNISSLTFASVSNLNETTISTSLQEVKINKSTFANDTSLTEIYLPKGVFFNTIDPGTASNLPFYNCFKSATYGNNQGIFLADTEIEYIAKKGESLNYKEGWNARNNGSTGLDLIPTYFYASSKRDVPANRVSDDHFWHFNPYTGQKEVIDYYYLPA